MLTEPKKLSRFLGSFYRKIGRLGPDIANSNGHPKVDRAVAFLRDRLSRGDANPRSWRALVVMFFAGRRYGLRFAEAWTKEFVRGELGLWRV